LIFLLTSMMNCLALVVLISYTKLLNSQKEGNDFVRMDEQSVANVYIEDNNDDSYQSVLSESSNIQR
jgi:hypothetical protein